MGSFSSGPNTPGSRTARKRKFLSIFGLMTVAGAALVMASLTNESFLRAQSPPIRAPKVRLPDESTGIDGIARTLVSAFDQADIVALGEAHQRKLDSDLRIALVRHPDFAKKVRSIVVEFGSTTEQSTLDRYIRGGTAQLAQVWKAQPKPPTGLGRPMYADFLQPSATSNGCPPTRIRVFGATPARRHRSETAAISVPRSRWQHSKAW
jgi:hypothetical protein